MEHEEATTPSPSERMAAPAYDQQDLYDQLLCMIKTGTPSDTMAAITTLKEDFFTLEAFLAHTEGLKALVEVLTIDALEQSVVGITSSEKDEVDWKSAVWELLLLILQNLDTLSLDEQDISKATILPVLSLVQEEKDAHYRRMALRFLLMVPNHNSACQDAIVESGGISLLVDALSTERDGESLVLLLKLPRCIAATSTSHAQEIDFVVQSIVDSNKPSELDHTNLLLLVYNERPPQYEPSDTAADRQTQLHLFTLEAAVNILYLASSSSLHKCIALIWLRDALPEIGFAFVFDHGGISLLWDILMVNESEEMSYFAIEILRWLARENQALRDRIFGFHSQYAAVQEDETKIKAASIRHQIFSGRNKRKRSDTETSENRMEQYSDMKDAYGGIESVAQPNETTIIVASKTLTLPELNAGVTQANETHSDCDEFLYSSSESDTENLESTSDFVSNMDPTQLPDREACTSEYGA